MIHFQLYSFLSHLEDQRPFGKLLSLENEVRRQQVTITLNRNKNNFGKTIGTKYKTPNMI